MIVLRNAVGFIDKEYTAFSALNDLFYFKRSLPLIACNQIRS